MANRLIVLAAAVATLFAGPLAAQTVQSVAGLNPAGRVTSTSGATVTGGDLTFSAASQSVVIDAAGAGGLSMSVSGTWTGTLKVQWSDKAVGPWQDGEMTFAGGAAATSITTNQQYVGGAFGRFARITTTSWTSGSSLITPTLWTQRPVASGGGGGGGGGAVTLVNGGDIAQGATTDAACANGSSTCTLIALLKAVLTAQQSTAPVDVQGAVNVASATTGGCTPYGYQSAASNNSTLIKSAVGTLCGGVAINTTATLYYVRLYNSATAPTCSSATNFVTSIPVPASTTGAGTIIQTGSFGWAFSNGISFCLTGGGASTDNTNAATGVFLSLGWK